MLERKILMGLPMPVAHLFNTCYQRKLDELFYEITAARNPSPIAPREVDLNNLLVFFNPVHRKVKFTREVESEGQFTFLDVCLKRLPDDSVVRSAYRKKSWSGQYIHFNSFVPLQQKRNLVRCLCERAGKICSVDTLQAELDRIHDALTQKGYPEGLIKVHMREIEPKPRQLGPERKKLYLNLPFKGDGIAQIIRSRIRRLINRTYPCVETQGLFYSRRMIPITLKDKLPRLLSSFCV